VAPFLYAGADLPESNVEVYGHRVPVVHPALRGAVVCGGGAGLGRGRDEVAGGGVQVVLAPEVRGRPRRRNRFDRVHPQVGHHSGYEAAEAGRAHQDGQATDLATSPPRVASAAGGSTALAAAANGAALPASAPAAVVVAVDAVERATGRCGRRGPVPLGGGGGGTGHWLRFAFPFVVGHEGCCVPVAPRRVVVLGLEGGGRRHHLPGGRRGAREWHLDAEKDGGSADDAPVR
jgi:hypothetical protein